MTTYNTKSSEPFDLIDQALERAVYFEQRLIELEPLVLNSQRTDLENRDRFHLEQMDYWYDLATKLEAQAEKFENFEANFGIRN